MALYDEFTTPAKVNAQIDARLAGQKNVPGGTPEIDETGKIPVELIPATSGYQGGAVLSTNPNEGLGAQFWQATQSGTYTNMGGLMVDLADGVTFLNFDGVTWTKATSEIPIEGYAPKTETDPAIRKIDGVTTESINLLDKNNVIFGRYFSFGGGEIVDSALYISAIAKVSPNTTYSYVGYRVSFSGNGYDNSVDPTDPSSFTAPRRTQIIGDNVGLKTQIQFTTDADTNYVGLNIVSNADTAYLDTMMLYEGVLGSETYQPYLNPVDPLKIKGGVASRAEFNQLELSQEAILSQFSINSYYRFDGTSFATLPIDYTLESIGDYVEWTGRDTKLAGDPLAQSLRVVGDPGNDNTFGYYDANKLYFRENNQSSAYISFVATGVNLKEINKIRLEINASDDWELFINDVSFGSTPRSDSFIARNIGNAGGDPKSKMDLINLKAKGTEGEINVTDFTALANTNVVFTPSATFVGTLPPIPDGDNYRDCYVEYDHSNGDSQPEFTIYVKISPSHYVGYQLYNDYNVGIYVDMFRIISATLYTFNGTVMTSTGIVILTGGESEAVFSESGKSDFSGGYHGDEIKQWVKFYLSNVEITPTADFPLTAADSFRYVQFSHVVETDDPSHTLTAHHYKETTFGSKGYLTKNKFIFQRTVDVQTLYLGISCIAHDNADEAMNEDFEFRTMNRSAGNGSTQYLGIEGAKTIEYTSPTNGLSATCFSEILDNPTLDSEGEAFTKDNAQYAKYYRGNNNNTFNNGDKITGICKVTHNKI